MPTSHRTSTVLMLLPVLLAGGACAGIAGAQATSEFTNSGQALGDSWSFTLALGDLDGDGDLDAMVANDYQPNTVWTNNGNGTFANSGQTLGDRRSRSVALGDLDGDGDLDAMVANDYTQPNTVWTNDGSGTFTNSGQALGNSDSYTVALGDLDGDGDLDAMVANFYQPNTVWTNDGSGTFTNSGQAVGSAADNSHSVALGDLDGDGDLDAMIGNYNMRPNTVWTNDGNGTFTNSGQTLGDSNSRSVALGDLDGDGDLDAMVANYEQPSEDYFWIIDPQPNTVWTNDGNGTFSNSGQALGNSFSMSVALGDLDSDGDLDAMVANGSYDGPQPNTVWTNDGSGTFTNSGQALGNSFSNSVALGDLDSDGDIDAMIGNYSSQPNRVWTNTVTGTGVCCAPSGCMLMTENLSGLCEGLGGTFLPQGSCDDCPSTCPADLNHDGVVDGFDLAVVLGAWGLPCDS